MKVPSPTFGGARLVREMRTKVKSRLDSQISPPETAFHAYLNEKSTEL
jgi:hypothetical protein